MVRGRDGLDEITLSGPTVIHEATPEGVRRFDIAPGEFGLAPASLDAVRGGSAETNAALILELFEGRRRDVARDLVLVNAAASLHVAGLASTLRAGVLLAAQALDSGAAAEKLAQLRERSHQ